MWKVLVCVLVVATLLPTRVCAESFPGTNPTRIGSSLPDGFEASGVSFLPSTETLAVVSDHGEYALVGIDGSPTTVFKLSSDLDDLESITWLPGSSNMVLVGVEWPPRAVLIDSTSGDVLKQWYLDGIEGDKSHGMEAMEFVPPHWLLGGSQATGNVSVYYFDGSEPDGSTLTPVDVLRPVDESGYTDLAGLSWDPVHGALLALFDKNDEIFVFCASPSAVGLGPLSLAAHYTDVKGDGQEGVAVAGSNGQYLVLAEDRNDEDKQVMRYDWDGVKC